MARTTQSAVEEIIENSTSFDLTPFIEAANHIITKVCTSTSYDATDLEIIERWLSAHFFAIYEARPTEERAGSVSARYQSKVDLGFDVTHYGQMAMRLAYEGELAVLNEQSKKGGKIIAGLTWGGTEDINNVSL